MSMRISLQTIDYIVCENHARGVMVSMLASSAVDRGFEPRSDQTNDYKIAITDRD
jgi:hypothetical protein